MNKFPAHGQLGIRVEGRLLIADVEGPWNVEFVRNALGKMAQQITMLSESGPWGLIVVIHKAAMCPPEALAGIRQGAIEQHARLHRVCGAHVIAPDVEGYGFMDRVWKTTFDGVHPFEVFETLPEAIAWATPVIEAATTVCE